MSSSYIEIFGACENNLKNIDIRLPKNKLIAITGVSGSGKSSLAYETILSEANRRFFQTLSHYTKQFIELGDRAQVASIRGLCPAIGLVQHEVQPSVRATVASFSDLAELVGVLYCRFGEKYCPVHNLATLSMPVKQIALKVQKDFAKSFLFAVTAPVVDHKRGQFVRKLSNLVKMGFSKLWCDGEILSINSLPDLNPNEYHTIKIIVDIFTSASQDINRLQKSLDLAMSAGGGVVECYCIQENKNLLLSTKHCYSSIQGCIQCGFSFPSLDSRYFTPNSLGKCETCEGRGEKSNVDKICESCDGVGIAKKFFNIYINNVSIKQIYLRSIESNYIFFLELKKNLPKEKKQGQGYVIDEILKIISAIMDMGLGYLNLGRRLHTLSLGEYQRLRLANIFCHRLSGLIYILDEPSQGLHPSEIKLLLKSLKFLLAQGSTVIVIDHDIEMLKAVDWIVDLGPGGGCGGGEVIAQFSPKDYSRYLEKSPTAQCLLPKNSKIKLVEYKKKLADFSYIKIFSAKRNNLKNIDVCFVKNGLNFITGVSGSGKSSLVIGTLYKFFLERYYNNNKLKLDCCKKIIGLDNVEEIYIIDRKPLAKNAFSFIATYLSIFVEIRKIFSTKYTAKMLGLDATAFSLRSQEGRCATCMGRGKIVLTMKFLEDGSVVCHDCQGRRFKPQILEVYHEGLNIADILELTIDQAHTLFSKYSKIMKPLSLAKEIGLGYLCLGQSLYSLSGGEAQRIKLVSILNTVKKDIEQIIIFDEPTRGLHEFDVTKLMKVIKKLANSGNTVLVIEHHLKFLSLCDWVVDMGPGAASQGGNVVYAGVPFGLKKIVTSKTAKYVC
jgi:excinuclease ABC subunit A